jgi:NADH-quinone oxidoreductase subunit E
MIGDRHHHDLQPDSLSALLRRPAPGQAKE